MKPSHPSTPSRETLEIKITALLLGELGPDEIAEIRLALESDPALRKFHDRMQRTVGLVREVSIPVHAGKPAETVTEQLSADRRQALLAQLKKPAPQEKKPAREEQPRQVVILNWLRLHWGAVAGMAACFIAFLGLLLPGLRVAKYKMTLMEQVGEPEADSYAASSATPVADGLNRSQLAQSYDRQTLAKGFAMVDPSSVPHPQSATPQSLDAPTLPELSYINGAAVDVSVVPQSSAMREPVTAYYAAVVPPPTTPPPPPPADIYLPQAKAKEDASGKVQLTGITSQFENKRGLAETVVNETMYLPPGPNSGKDAVNGWAKETPASNFGTVAQGAVVLGGSFNAGGGGGVGGGFGGGAVVQPTPSAASGPMPSTSNREDQGRFWAGRTSADAGSGPGVNLWGYQNVPGQMPAGGIAALPTTPGRGAVIISQPPMLPPSQPGVYEFRSELLDDDSKKLKANLGQPPAGPVASTSDPRDGSVSRTLGIPMGNRMAKDNRDQWADVDKLGEELQVLAEDEKRFGRAEELSKQLADQKPQSNLQTPMRRNTPAVVNGVALSDEARPLGEKPGPTATGGISGQPAQKLEFGLADLNQPPPTPAEPAQRARRLGRLGGDAGVTVSGAIESSAEKKSRSSGRLAEAEAAGVRREADAIELERRKLAVEPETLRRRSEAEKVENEAVRAQIDAVTRYRADVQLGDRMAGAALGREVLEQQPVAGEMAQDKTPQKIETFDFSDSVERLPSRAGKPVTASGPAPTNGPQSGKKELSQMESKSGLDANGVQLGFETRQSQVADQELAFRVQGGSPPTAATVKTKAGRPIDALSLEGKEEAAKDVSRLPVAVDPATGLPVTVTLAASEGRTIPLDPNTGLPMVKTDAPIADAFAKNPAAATNAVGAPVDLAGVLAPAAQEPPAPPKPILPPADPLPEVLTAAERFSTFSLNVSDVSFKLAAASLGGGTLPEPATVRSEEFVNAMNYHDPAPAPGAKLALAWDQARHPFEHNRDLLRFSIQTAAIGREAGRPLNLVLLLDNSGSMERADRVLIIRQALGVLAQQLTPADRISVVAFARTPRLWVDGMQGGDPAALVQRVGNLNPEGGTNLELALNEGYATAQKHFFPNGNNRVILLTDGAANLGNVNPAQLKQKVESFRRKNIALDCFGVGWEGYNDDLLESLSRNGDGRYGFINNPLEAAMDFAGQLAGALRVAAADVKAQVEFNPDRVILHRQIGYEKHRLTKEQFRDNTVDAAEIGAAESGTALYSIQVNAQGKGPLGVVRVRFKVPSTGRYQEQEWLLPYNPAVPSLDRAYPSMKMAAVAALFAEWLAHSPFAGNVGLSALQSYLQGVPETFPMDMRPGQLQTMLQQARTIAGQ